MSFNPNALTIPISWLKSKYSFLAVSELLVRVQERQLSIIGDKATLVGRLVENDAIRSGVQQWPPTQTWMMDEAIRPTDIDAFTRADAFDHAVERELLNSDYAILTEQELQRRCHRRQLAKYGDKASLIRNLMQHDATISTLAQTFFLRALSVQEYMNNFTHGDLRHICQCNNLSEVGTFGELAVQLSYKEGLIWNGYFVG